MIKRLINLMLLTNSVTSLVHWKYAILNSVIGLIWPNIDARLLGILLLALGFLLFRTLSRSRSFNLIFNLALALSWSLVFWLALAPSSSPPSLSHSLSLTHSLTRSFSLSSSSSSLFLLLTPPTLSSSSPPPTIGLKTSLDKSTFLDVPSHLYKRLCVSVGPSVRPSVDPSVDP